MRRMLILVSATIVWFISLTVAVGYAEEFTMKGRAGAGLQVNFLNFGLGPSVEYWGTENIGISGSIGAVADFTSYGIRGNYLFDRKLDIFGLPTRPYLGIGYASITGPEYSFWGVTSETKGSGIEIYAGLLRPARYIYENVYTSVEFTYSTINVETTITAPYIGSQTFDAGYNDFSIGWKIVYYFK